MMSEPPMSHASSPQPSRSMLATPSPELLQSLAGLNANRDLAIVHRTRRAVYVAAQELRAERKRRRRTMGLALSIFAVLFVLLTPALWGTLEDFLNDQNLAAGADMVTVFLLVSFAVVLTALFMGLKNQQQQVSQKNRRI